MTDTNTSSHTKLPEKVSADDCCFLRTNPMHENQGQYTAIYESSYYKMLVIYIPDDPEHPSLDRRHIAVSITQKGSYEIPLPFISVMHEKSHLYWNPYPNIYAERTNDFLTAASIGAFSVHAADAALGSCIKDLEHLMPEKNGGTK